MIVVHRRASRGGAFERVIMPSYQAQKPAVGPASEALLASIAADGVASHHYLADGGAFAGPEATRNLADVVHFLCLLHGRHPGLVDHAFESTTCIASQRWLGLAAPAFAVERLYLTRLAVAVGPVPSTPGSAESEAAVMGQRHAMQMLARSERKGCPLGATIALIVDWQAIRPLLDRAAHRLGLEPATSELPGRDTIDAVLGEIASEPGVGRALNFGAEQVLVQHRGLLDLLEARQSARREI